MQKSWQTASCIRPGGAFLVTGFRGVGKTTFVHYALQFIRANHQEYVQNRSDFVLLDVWINLSRPVSPSQLMHLMIRHLYLRLREAGLLSELVADLREDIEAAFLRTSFEISSKASEDKEWSTKAEVGYEHSKWLGLEFLAGC
jgi:hypothetical protein